MSLVLCCPFCKVVKEGGGAKSVPLVYGGGYAWPAGPCSHSGTQSGDVPSALLPFLLWYLLVTMS